MHYCIRNRPSEIFAELDPKLIKKHKIIRKEFRITGERFDRSTMPSIGIGAKLSA
jgi:hypothetical protein